MNETLRQIRNVVFYVQCAMFVAMLCILGPRFFHLCAVFGVVGLATLMLSIKVVEPRIQKLFFILAGGAGTASLITLAVFYLLAWSGHTPGGDGGGITVPMLIVVCPALFLIGAVGSTVCRIKGRIAARRNKA